MAKPIMPKEMRAWIKKTWDKCQEEAWKEHMTPDYEVTHNDDGTFSVSLPDGDELRIVPPKREWVGLTDEEIRKTYFTTRADYVDFAKAIESKLKEKNGG